MKEVMILGGLVLFLGALIAAVWFYGQVGDPVKVTASTEQIDNANVSEMLKKASTLNQAEASTSHTPPVTAPAMSMPDILHSDILFEVGRKGLTDEGTAQLAAHADMLKHHEEYGVLIQGYTDQQGSAGYNKQLGLKRAETVKAGLVNAGIDEHRIKVVSLGEAGVLCVDASEVCRRINRRVHLEIRKIGREHMAAPTVAPTTATDPSGASIESSITTEETGSSTETVGPLTPEPASGQ
jgi:peptidoglycan-associated lipoprotein